VADVGTNDEFVRWVASYDEYLAACGAIGLGELIARGARRQLDLLRHAANDHRWRVREEVAIGLQRLGDADMAALLHVARAWSAGSPLEQRAEIAAVCEPRLLGERSDVEQVIGIVDAVTAALQQTSDRRADEMKALRNGLGYCWTVALAC